MWVLVILLYLLGMTPTYYLFEENTKQSTFNKVWFTIFWPAMSIMYPIGLLMKRK